MYVIFKHKIFIYLKKILPKLNLMQKNYLWFKFRAIEFTYCSLKRASDHFWSHFNVYAISWPLKKQAALSNITSVLMCLCIGWQQPEIKFLLSCRQRAFDFFLSSVKHPISIAMSVSTHNTRLSSMTRNIIIYDLTSGKWSSLITSKLKNCNPR